MRFYARLLSIAVFFLVGCGQENAVNYGFSIKDVSVSRVYQALNIRLQQELALSQQARDCCATGSPALSTSLPAFE